MIIQSKEIKLVPLKKLKPKTKNRNKHPLAQIEMLAKHLKYQGFRNPLIVSNQSGEIVCGHGRFEAAKMAGFKEIPVIYQDFESPDQEYAYHVADNGLSLWSELDLSGINNDVADLGPDFDIDLLGIRGFILEPAEKLEPQCDEDELPDKVEPKSKLGDIYKLGNHRLMCGDSTNIQHVETLMDGKKADLTFTSPPYNANTKAGDGDIFSSKKSKKLYGNGYSDNLDSDSYIDFAKSVLEICFIVTEGFIFWNVSYNANSRFEYIKQIENRISSLIEQICWKKSSTIPFKGSLMRDWEPIYLFSTDGRKLGLEKVTSNHWEIGNANSQQENHKACYPVALPEKGIEIVKPITRIVFDPFCGSGTTIIAAEKLQRSCFGMEIDPYYVDVIVARWEKYTGQKAELING